MGAEHASAAYEATVKIINPDDFLQRLIDQAKNDTKVIPRIPLAHTAGLSILREAQKELTLR